MSTSIVPPSHPLMRLFRGLTECTFMSELGIADPPLVGYVADLLVRFVPSDNIWRVRDVHGRRITQVTAMIEEAETSNNEDRRRECHRHVGDFTLFWTGVYPEALPALQAGSPAEALINLQRQGKRSYYLASASEGEEAQVLRRLSDEFELCAFGLSRVRREWERSNPEPPGPGRRPLVA
jgi:hypothetical protein